MISVLRTMGRLFRSKHAVVLCTLLAACVFAVPALVAEAAQGSCGQPVSQGASPAASDALRILQTAVGASSCGVGIDPCVCDVNGDASVTAGDALLTLKAVVGHAVTLACDCGDTTPPSVPEGLQVTVVSPSRIEISWDASSDDVAVSGYFVYGGSFNARAVVGTSTADTNPKPATLYCYAVSAIDSSGNESTQCNAVCVTTEPGPGDHWVTRLAGTEMNLEGVVWTGSRYVVVGDEGQVLVSDDARSWTAHEPPLISPQGVNDVVWSGEELVAAKRLIYSSTDGIFWSVRYFGTREVQDLAWSNSVGRYAAVGEDGLILSSVDANTWIAETSHTDQWLNGVAWGNDRYVAVGDLGTIVTSSNGTDWTSLTPVTDGSLNAVVWSGAKFVAVGMGVVLTSDDGASWTVEAYTPPDILSSVAWSADLGLFAAVGWNGAIVTSPDGVDWTDRSIDLTFLAFNDVTWSGTEFVAVGEEGEIATSSDGANWRIVLSGADLTNVVWTGDEFVAMGGFGKIVTSVDGSSWSYGYTGDAWDYLLDLADSGTAYVAGAYSFLLSSPDLMTWPGREWLGATSSCPGIVWDGARFVAVCTHGVVYTSADGSDWSFQLLSGVPDFYDIVWTGEQYLAVGHTGTILSSPDASDWNPETSNTASRLRSIAWSGTLYAAVGDAGTIVTSPDGVTWTPQSSEVSTTLYNVIWTGTEFVAVGSSGTIVRSADGIAWSPSDVGYATLGGVAWSGTRLVVVGSESTILTLD
jgi:hypothetical protein